MNDGFAFFDIIIFAMLAGYLVFQLRKALGRKTDNQRPEASKTAKSKTDQNESDNVVSLREEQTQTSSGTKTFGGLESLRQRDSAFNDREFVQGSKQAFQWIVSSFSEGNVEKLKQLLGPALFRSFEKAIEERKEGGLSLETNIVSIKSVQINEVVLNENLASITVEFVTDQIKVITNAEGSVVDGDPDTIETVTDLWTFSRDITSTNPNWLLVRTETPEDTS